MAQNKVTVRKKKKFSPAILIIAVIACFCYLFPMYVLLNMSLRSLDDIGSKLVFPEIINIGNYLSVLRNGSVWIGFKNSIILVTITVTVEIVASALGGYGISRSNNRMSEWIRHGSMAVMMVPGIALLVGTYSMMTKLGMVNSLWGLALLTAAGGIPGCMFLYTNFVSSIPQALDEAATIDGANVLQTFFKIILPQLRAVTITRIIVIATGCWNAYLMPLYLLQKKQKHTIILVIKSAFSSLNGIINVPRACATCVIGILPIVILFIFLQKYIIEGQLDSSVK